MNEPAACTGKAPVNDRRPFISKELLWILVMAAGLLVIFLSPLREHLTHIQQLSDDIRGIGHLSALVFLVCGAIAIAFGLPRLLVAPVAGATFGFALGLPLSLSASLLGSYGAFCYARWAGRDLIMRRWPRIVASADRFESTGVLAVAIVRQLPNPGFLTNIFLGVTRIRHGAFLLGSILGFLPSSVPAILIGTSVLHESHSERIQSIMLAAIWIVIAVTALTIYLRRHPGFRIPAIRKAASPDTADVP